MGQPNSTESGELDARETVKYQEFVKNYQFLRKIKDPRYGEISILQDKYTKELVALREVLSKSAKDFERDMISLRSRYRISHPNIIKVLGYTSKSEDNFCASIHKILMIVEYLDNDLEKEISLKKNQTNYYKEEQLWYLIENVVKALSTLQKNEISHEDLKPSAIFISKMGVYKIAQHNIAGNAMPAYHQRMTGLTDGRTYLSPALLTNLQTSEVRPQHNPWKSDVFSLGMTLLHAATLTNCEKLYNWNNFTLDLEELGERIASLRPRYSERFQDLIQTMLDLRENSRPDFLALESKLSTASESNERGNPTPGHSPLRPRANEEQQDIPDDAYEDIGHYRQNIKQNIVRATPYDETGPYLQKNVVNPIFKGENRIAPLRSDENYSSVESGQHSKRTLPQDTTKTVDPRAPNFWNNARANEPASHNLREIGGHDLYNRPNNLQNQQQAAAVMAHERVFDKGYGFANRDEPSEFAVKTRSANTIDQSHGLYQGQRSEARTQVSSITNIHNEQQQQQAQGQNAKVFESNDNLRKSLISDEVARIMSDFRSKMGISASEAGYAHDSLFKNQKENIRGYDDIGYNKDIYGGESKYKGAAGYSENLPLSSQPVVNTVFHANTNYTTFAQQESVKMAPRDFKEERGFQPGSSYEQSKDFLYGNYQNKPETHALTDRSLNFANQQTSNFNVGYEQSQQTYYNNQDFKQDISSKPWEQQYASHSQSRNDPFMSQALKSEPSVQAWDQQYVKQVESNPQYNYYNGSTFKNEQQTSLAHTYGGQQQNLHVTKENDLYSQNYTSMQSHGQSVDAYAQNREKSPEAYYEYESKQPENQNLAAYSSVNSAQNRLSPAGATESELVNESYPDGSVYEGSKVNGLRHGKGTFYYADGGVYDGDWIEGSMEGYGLLYYSSGAKAYEGEWKEDKFHGRGAVYNEMPAQLMEGFDFTNFDNVGDYWMSYEGDFFNDNKEGNGVLLLSNGERFEGQFKEDMVDGIGAYYMADGRVIKGEWWQNKLVKPL